jgi:N utilization substance protein B
MKRSFFTGRRASRFFAVQAAYQLEHDQKSVFNVIQEFIQHQLSEDGTHPVANQTDINLFRHILMGVDTNKESIDTYLTSVITRDWNLNRLNAVMLATLRCAAFEMYYDLETPHPIVINEYLEVSKKFFPQSEMNFINVVLDNLSKQQKSQNHPSE